LSISGILNPRRISAIPAFCRKCWVRAINTDIDRGDSTNTDIAAKSTIEQATATNSCQPSTWFKRNKRQWCILPSDKSWRKDTRCSCRFRNWNILSSTWNKIISLAQFTSHWTSSWDFVVENLSSKFTSPP
jgi:hypothetical protein